MLGHAKLSYEELTTLLALSIWISELGQHVTPEGKKILHFMYGIPDHNEHMRGSTFEAVQHVVRTQSPSGRVIKYINDQKHGLTVAITINEAAQQINVIFRGTDASFNWLAGFKAWKCKISTSIAVHSGCLKAIELHKTTLYRTIDALLKDHPTYNIVMTGHGLGGALCTLFGFLTAERLSSTSTTVKVVSFGSPRVGNLAFRQAVDATDNLSVVRVTHQRDLVTATPLYRYAHVGQTVIHLQRNGGFKIFENYSYSVLTYSLFRCWAPWDRNRGAYWAALRNSTGEVNFGAGATEQLIPSGVEMY